MICRLILLRTTNISDKLLEKIKTHFMFSIIFLKIVQSMRYCGKIW